MRAFDVDFFEFSPGANVQDFDGLAGFEPSFECEWANCFHSVLSGSKHNGASASALIFHWLLLFISCFRRGGGKPDSLRIFSEMLDRTCLTAAFFPI